MGRPAGLVTITDPAQINQSLDQIIMRSDANQRLIKFSWGALQTIVNAWTAAAGGQYGTTFTLTSSTPLVRATHNLGAIYNTGASAAVQHTLWAGPQTNDSVTFFRVPMLPGSPNWGRSPEVRFAPQAGHSIHGGTLGKAGVMLDPGRTRIRWNGTLWVVEESTIELDWEP